MSDELAWIGAQLGRLGLRLAGEVDEHHVRPWSRVLRVPTGDGDVWFKQGLGAFSFEAALLEVLAERRPDCLPELLAVDPERGRMLLADGGTRLREVGDLDRWEEVLPLYAQLQIDVAVDRDRLLATGARDRRLAVLPELCERLVTDRTAIRGLEPDEVARLQGVPDRARALCGELAGYGLPETIQHDDLHDGNVFVRDGRYLVFDWGDACVAQPFSTMYVTLRVLADRLGVADVAPELDRFRDAYLEPWTSFGSRDELLQAFSLGYRLGSISRAQAWLDVGDDWPDALRITMQNLADEI